MLLRVSLRNYRSIESAEVELARFSLLVGPNSSGKSNFADALVLASELGFDAASAIQRRGGLQALRRWGIPDEEALQVKVRASASREALDVSYAEQSFSLVPEEGRAGSSRTSTSRSCTSTR
ncbi:AAA family ATPase [Cystobacter fuscus]